MNTQSRWPRQAWLPIAAGLVWLWHAQQFSWPGFIPALVPGCLLLSCGFSTLLYPGDGRIPQFIALGGVLGTLLALPALWLASFSSGLLLLLLSGASFISAGWISLHQEPHFDEVPPPQRSLGIAAEAALDDTVLAILGFMLPMFAGREQSEICREVLEARAFFKDRGWLAHPLRYHQTPPALENLSICRQRVRGLEFEFLTFTSDYDPHPGEPGRERWLSYEPNRTAYARVLRHSDGERPWLICLHSYQGGGTPGMDFPMFKADLLYHKGGLNLAFPVLPFHGLRRVMRFRGQGFLAGDILDTVHAEAQAVWEMRQLIAWIRAQGATRIGVYGISLGGYNTALLAAFEEDLACAIAGIPATDFARLTWRHGPPLQIRYGEHYGMVHDVVSEVLQVISPLALAPKVSKAGRFIYAAVSDQLVPPDQVRDLWRHWDRPPMLWYQGAHMTFQLHPSVRAFLDQALLDSGLLQAPVFKPRHQSN